MPKNFLFIQTVSHRSLEALKKHLNIVGLSPHVHCNAKRLPQNMFLALGIVDNSSEIHGLPLPGRMPIR